MIVNTAPYSNAASYRPSTSPIGVLPGGGGVAAPQNARPMTKQHTNGRQQQQQPPVPSTSAQPAAVRLRPLPPTAQGAATTGSVGPSTLPPASVHRSASGGRMMMAASNSMPSFNASTTLGGSTTMTMMMIEGKTTGEEIERSTVDRRESGLPPAPTLSATGSVDGGPATTRRGSSVGTPSNAASGDTERLKQRIRKLEGDLRKSQEVAKRKQSEKTTLQQELENHKTDLEASQSQLAAAKQRLSETTTAHRAELDALRSERDAAKAEALSSREGAKEKTERDAEAHANRLSLEKKAWDGERDALRKKSSEHETEAETQRKRADLLQTQLDAARLGLAENQKKTDGLALAKATAEADAAAQLRSLQQEAEEARATLAGWQERIRAVDAFVLEICQPHFSVVKDEGLTPMSGPSLPGGGAPDGAEGKGFVLVPLPLLLQGYALLPTDKKKGIAERYEASKQQLRSNP